MHLYVHNSTCISTRDISKKGNIKEKEKEFFFFFWENKINFYKRDLLCYILAKLQSTPLKLETKSPHLKS